ncbi:diguanylate cyclase [Glaciecola sp. KUL10]|uniref:GGDEF domain-containing response regulator n=1 Tax=Glaciecola sp. (strain KUL10) TaxID=2161813 RepID=UPI000D789182|nr:diguanylate cyclase [Glaciecola sp. KUL10]GBL04764.1 response regulator receiver modulated diguanylate cyclase [Glaciecola sp. KUL10]
MPVVNQSNEVRHLPDSCVENAQKVLVVDDSLSALQLLSALLGKQYTLSFAQTISDAKRQVEIHTPDIILLDVMLDKEYGYELLSYLKSNPYTRTTPVIMVSSMDQSIYKKKAFELGCVDYITKPYDVIELILRIKAQLGIARKLLDTIQLASQDALTGLANRRRYDELFAAEWQLCLQYKQSLSLMVLDIDYFKLFNDRYGHAAGDKCLKKIGSALKGMGGRKYDLVARYGGEEFVILLPECSPDGLISKSQDVLNAVRGLRIQHEDSKATSFVTVSIGGATAYPCSALDPIELFSTADEALYRVKSNTKNGCDVENVIGETAGKSNQSLRNLPIENFNGQHT